MYFLVFCSIFLSLISLSIQLNNNAPIIQEIFVSKNLNENQTAKLICSLLQGENVQFNWYLNGEKLTGNSRRKIKSHDESSDLVIKSLSVDDIGRYFCEISNEFGSDKKNVDLYFNVKASWLKEPDDVKAPLNQELILNCSAKAFPDAVTKWFKLDKDRKIIKNFDSGEIKFNLFTKEDAGLYRCVSENLISSIEKTI